MVYGGCLYDSQRVSGWYFEGVYRYLNGAYIVSKGQVRTSHNSIPTCKPNSNQCGTVQFKVK